MLCIEQEGEMSIPAPGLKEVQPTTHPTVPRQCPAVKQRQQGGTSGFMWREEQRLTHSCSRRGIAVSYRWQVMSLVYICGAVLWV